MERSPNFERLKKAIFFEEPDYVPIAEMVVDAEVKKAFLGKKIDETVKKEGPVTVDLQENIEFWKRAGYDYINISPEVFCKIPEIRRTGRGKYSLYQEEDQEKKWANEGQGVIGSMKDLEEYVWPDLSAIDYGSIFREIEKGTPPGMKVICQGNNILNLAWRMMGLEGFSLAIFKEPDLVQKVVAKCGEITMHIFHHAAEFSCVGGLWYGDDVAYVDGLMWSPKVLKKYLYPWLEETAEICRRHHLLFIYHSDGDIRKVVDDLIGIGAHAIHPIEPKAMDIKEMKKKYAGKIALIGNIDLNYTLTLGSPAEVEEEVKQRIREIAPGGGYCLGSSMSVTNYVPIENYKAMLGAAMKYGKYPISL